MEDKIVEGTTIDVPDMPVSDVDLSIFRSYDQSVRAKHGHEFNQQVTEMLLSVADGKNVIFLRAEPIFEKKWTKRGFKCRPIKLQMDHAFLVIDHAKMEILYAMSDGTTTFRNDRAKIKRAEGLDQIRLKDVIEAELLKTHPEYRDYCITHVNLFVFPSVMSGTLKRRKAEAQAIREFCTNTNHSTNSFRSVVGCHQIDAAMTIEEMKAVINELNANRANYSFTQNAFANAWKNLYTTFDYLPTRDLTIANAKDFKDHLLYSLDTHANDYSRAELVDFAKKCNIKPWRKTWTNKAMVRVIRDYIDKHF